MTEALAPLWRREGRRALIAALAFAVLCQLTGWPVNPLIGMVMIGAVWGVSLLLRANYSLTAVDGRDCVIAGVLIAAALVVRMASPIFPDILQGDFNLFGTVAAPSGVHYGATHEFLGIGAWGLGFPTDPSGCTDAPVGHDNAEVKTCGFVFDEVYFPVDALKDLKGIDYFDPEPPLTKLIIAGGISWLGFNPWGWRIMSAIFGSLIIGLLYFLARRLWKGSRIFAVLAALFFSLDGLELVDSRTGVIDVIAIFFVVLTYWMFLLHWHARTPSQWRWTVYLTGLAGGLALACKADVIPALVLICLLLLGRWLRPRLRWRLSGSGPNRWLLPPVPDDPVEAGRRAMIRSMRWGGHYLLAAGLILFIFYLSFFRYWTISHNLYVNFADTRGPSAACTSLTTEASVCRLPTAMPLGELHLGPVNLWLPTGFNPVQSVVDVEMDSLGGLSYQATLQATQPFSSPFYSWPLDGHPVLYNALYTGFGVSQSDGQTVSNYSWVDDMGSPAVLWLGMFALALCLFWVIRRRDRIAFFILAGFLFDWLLLWSWPSRILFFYEFLEAVPFVCLALAYLCARLWRKRTSLQVAGLALGPYSLRPLAGAVVLAVIITFGYFYPLWTGMPIPSNDFFQHIWIPGWY